jgi:hypothetical protein
MVQRIIKETVPLTAPSVLGGETTVKLTTTADLTKQYVSSDGVTFVQQYARTLTPYIDDITADFGVDLYERMRKDPQVESALAILFMAVLAHGYAITPNLKKDMPDYDQSEKIAKFVQTNLDRLRTPLMSVLHEMLLALAYGHKVAELLYEIGTLDPDSPPQMLLADIRPKPQTSTAFVVDRFNNVLGYLWIHPGGTIPGLALLPTSLQVNDPGTTENPTILPPEKFWNFAYHVENGDPRGTSVLRPAYHAWWTKAQLQRSYLAFLATFAQPSIAIFTDPEAEPPEEFDPATGAPLPQRSAEQIALEQAKNIQNGSCAAFPGGARLQVVETHNDGTPFQMAMDLYNREITKTIIGQTLMTEEGQHMSRAAAATHQDVFGVLVRHVKLLLADSFRQQVITTLVRYNFGDEAADRFCPNVSLGETEHQDFPQNANAVAALVREGYFDTSQYEELDNLLALPPRDPESWGKRLELEAQILAISAQPPPVAGAAPAAPGGASGQRVAQGQAGGATGKQSAVLQSDEQNLTARVVAKRDAQRAGNRLSGGS